MMVKSLGLARYKSGIFVNGPFQGCSAIVEALPYTQGPSDIVLFRGTLHRAFLLYAEQTRLGRRMTPSES